MFLFLFSTLLVFSAQQQNQIQNMNETNQIETQNIENKNMNETPGQQNNEQERLENQTQNQEQEELKNQTKNTEKEMIKEQSKVINKDKENKTQIQNENITANTEMNLVQEENKVQVQLSNGRNAEIKVMPNTASETAIERLRLHVCSEDNNCTIELKEVGTGNETKAAYEVKAEKKTKLLGLFETKMQVKAQVDAENGEIIREEKPWWAFLTIDEKEE